MSIKNSLQFSDFKNLSNLERGKCLNYSNGIISEFLKAVLKEWNDFLKNGAGRMMLMSIFGICRSLSPN